ncbi:MAG: hypothetical protein UX09_C0060G0008 [Candidatus Uhrbacteria bacterium GW2011_GWE2_45_35]|uniref:Uncharacterized protein n=2 Tax=Candidatus Uhriibacteriota TaxID=1752732 RepID=A0A0G1JAU6_9BACT|nr:MAG: hypothetical protein UW63_C0076G0008 [Candidatus Uhrbacteria bacterium GW2011_GWF2_44_350]KKU06073.1 MAG: hypothetical protein UX09_C0060G0008 [Candidatus Uhrbacteria bacterium GW2011_GWE2_45_35]HBR81105.1 hypothetical protein [Candidatus Uhrbacteria bacterium]HCU32135.1 hypothetical protein [Candidatus Uhrbacteria bacterium]
MFSTNLFFAINFLSPDFLIFFIFGALAVFTFWLRKKPQHKLIVWLLFLLEATFVWKLLAEIFFPLSHLVTEQYLLWSVVFITHRWLVLLPIPFLLATAIVILLVYHDKISDHHAREYRRCFSLLMVSSFVLFLLSFGESLF